MRHLSTYQRRTASHLGIVLCLLIATHVRAQTPRDVQGDVPWRSDRGAGSLTEPGASRFLPPTERQPQPTPTQPVPTEPTTVPAEHREVLPPQPPPLESEQWWKEDAETTVADPDSSLRGQGKSPRGEIILSTQILSMVGSEPILAGDLLARINEALKPMEGKAPEEEIERQRWLLLERMLPAAIEAKLVYLDFTRRLDKEQVDVIRVSIFEQFDEKQLPQMVESADVLSAAELDAKMRTFGSSLEAVRRSFFEQVTAREMIRKNGTDDSDVTHDDLLDYYKDHSEEFEITAKSRWEHMLIRFDKFDTKRDAYKALADMGNAVLHGAPFGVVAKRSSHGPRSEQGGEYDWTLNGSLASKVMDHAIFSLPVGKMSAILEDKTGFHIVRVIERQEAGQIPFVEAQVGIREKIKEERRDENVKSYLERLKRETYVWNYFSDDTQIAERDRQLR